MLVASQRHFRGACNQLTRIKSRGLLTSDADGHQADATDQCEPAERRGNWDRLFLFMADLQRTQINVLLFVGEGKASERKANDGENDQESADDCCGFHIFRTFLLFARSLHQYCDASIVPTGDTKVHKER